MHLRCGNEIYFGISNSLGLTYLCRLPHLSELPSDGGQVHSPLVGCESCGTFRGWKWFVLVPLSFGFYENQLPSSPNCHHVKSREHHRPLPHAARSRLPAGADAPPRPTRTCRQDAPSAGAVSRGTRSTSPSGGSLKQIRRFSY